MKELLERWAVAEPGRVIKNTASTAHHYGCTGPYMVYIDDKFHDLEYGLDTRWMQSIVQGAVQQVIEARGWQFDMDNHGNPDDRYNAIRSGIFR